MKENRRGKRWTAEESGHLFELSRNGVSLWRASCVLKRTKKAVMLQGAKLGLSFGNRSLSVRSRKDKQDELPFLFDDKGKRISVKTQKVGDVGCTTITATPHRKMRRTKFPTVTLETTYSRRPWLGTMVIILTGIFSLILPIMWAFGELEMAKHFSFVTLLMFALLAVHLMDEGVHNG